MSLIRSAVDTIIERATGAILAVAVIAGAAGSVSFAGTRGCDISGWDKTCAVQGGEYRALVPEGDGPFPAMVYLYGSGGQSVEIANHPLFHASVTDRGYALIVPAALGMEYGKDRFDTGWALRNEPGGRRDEVTFIQRVIADAARRFNIDRARTVLVGQSRGAFLIWEIACHAPDTAAAYAVHAGGYLGPLPQRCVGPVRFLHSHGLSDPVVPLAGPPVVSGGVAMAPIRDSLDLLASTAHCKAPAAGAAEPMSGMARQRWTGCAAGGSLDLLLHEGGHTMPPEWFGAVLDWFEEPPAATTPVEPVSRVAGTRGGEGFRALPEGGKRLSAEREDGVKRLQAPVAGTRKLLP